MGKQMVRDIEEFADLFANGMGRRLPGLYGLGETLFESVPCVVNLGAGDSPIDGALNLSLPEWHAPEIPYSDEQVDVIHAYHFLEHLDPEVMLEQLMEIERVLKPSGFANIVVPYAHSDLAYQDPTHRTFFTEETWKTIFNNQYYRMTRTTWKLRVHFNLIAGIVGRNLAIFTQLVKEEA